MKAGITASVTVHLAALAVGVVSLAAPKPLSVPDVEALPIDIVPIEAITKSVRGDKKAPVKKPPAPKQTKLPPKVPNAQNVGETKTDIKADAPQSKKAPPVEQTEAPSAPPEPATKPTPVPTPTLAPEPKPKTDIALLLKKSQEPTPTEEPKEVEEEAFEKLPERVATPKARPQRKQPELAKTNDRKKEDNKVAEAKKSDNKKTKDVTKKAVVNKADANAGGAKSSTKEAGLGTKKGNAGKLAQSEIDALRGRLEGCWSVADLSGHPDAQKMRARVTFKLTREGTIDGRVKVKVSGTDRSTRAILAVRVRAAVSDCAPYTLPPEKYETWSDVVVNFSLQDML